MSSNNSHFLYLAGFLGHHSDMIPLALKGAGGVALSWQFDLREASTFDEFISGFESKILDRKPTVLIGYSFGGRILREIYRRGNCPGRYIFISTRLSVPEKDEIEKRKEAAKHWLSYYETNGLQKFLTSWEGQRLFNGHSMKDYRKSLNLNGPRIIDSDILNYFKIGFPLSQEPLTFSSDCHFICGENDSSYLEEAKKVSISHSIVPGAGHRCCFEKPEEVKKMILEWVKEIR